VEDGAFEVTQVVIGRTAAAQPEQFRLVLDQVDSDSPLGIRDAALLLFLYNTGARVSEVLQITWSDLHLDRPAQVRLHGKGNNYAKVVVMQRCHAVGTNPHPIPTGICGASESTNAL
jgi:site-specific recombinase XerD